MQLLDLKIVPAKSLIVTITVAVEIHRSVMCLITSSWYRNMPPSSSNNERIVNTAKPEILLNQWD